MKKQVTLEVKKQHSGCRKSKLADMSTDPVFMKIGSEYYWYHNDHLGTPQMMTTSSGAVVWKAKYSSFGKAAVDASSAVANPLRFSGQYEDAETGIYYNRFRYYLPMIGRYLKTDPICFYGGINLYTYVHNDPIDWIDPYGLHERGFKHDHSGKDTDYYANANKLTRNITFDKKYDDLDPIKKLSVDHHERTHIVHPLWTEERVLKEEVDFIQRQIDDLDPDDPQREVLKKWKKTNEQMWRKEKEKNEKRRREFLEESCQDPEEF